jgi:hypothetical protein
LIRLILNKRILFLSFVLIALFNNNVFGQKVVRLDTIENIVYLGNFKLKTPSLFKSKYTYDPILNKYIYQTTVGEIDVGIPLVLTPKQYRKRIREENIKNYFTEKIDLLKDEDAEDVSKLKNLLPDLYVNSNFFQSIFGGDKIELIPQGSISMDIGARYQKSDNPSIPSRNQSNIGLDFNQNISLSMNGKIGERLSISSNYDTQSTFDFQNLLKLDYTPTEDDIIQKIELGNVSMPLSGSLISGAQSLFGFKTQLKWHTPTLEWEPFEARPRSGGVGTRRCYAARRLPPRGWNSSRSVWRQAGYGGQRHDAFLRSAFTLRTTIATSTFITGVQRSSVAPGMTLLVFFWHEGGRK